MGSEKVSKPPRKKPVLQRVWDDWITTLDRREYAVLAKVLSSSQPENISFKISYLKYDNLVVVHLKSLQKDPLASIIKTADLHTCMPRLWQSLARLLRVSHVGCTAPIPLHVPEAAAVDTTGVDSVHGFNVLRTPASFQPLYGEFGGLSSSFSQQTAEATFWSSATQHGVTQFWSPLHTMFSNGNISEKARVMNFGRSRGSTAVDLYAGIGYFALFYRKYVADVVVGFEINPWSVQGFKRGAIANGWGGETIVVSGNDNKYEPGDGGEAAESDTKAELSSAHASLVMFEDSNEHAVDRIQRIQNLPPIRHVNCGYLPTSMPSWTTAVRLLLHSEPASKSHVPSEPLGWVHAHENIAIADIGARSDEVVAVFRKLVEVAIKEQGRMHFGVPEVSCSNVAQVKTYAPGVMHCVLDIQIEHTSHTPR